MKRAFIVISGILLFVATGQRLAAQDHFVPIQQPDLSQKTGIAPAFWGPNAFQVPDMLDGTVSHTLKFEVAGGYADGRITDGGTDRTGDIFVKLNVPLWTDRVNLSAWWSVHEWYSMSDDVKAARRIDPSISGKGHETGAAYISIDGEILREKKYAPAISARICLRTASEGTSVPFGAARSYDAAGYFFDLSVGKSFGPVRIAASGGFLCWQTDNGRQNDAVMFGALASYSSDWVSVNAQYGGYWGWERYGDFPRVIKARLDLCNKWIVHPFATFQYGFHDWPFWQARAGIQLNVNIL